MPRRRSPLVVALALVASSLTAQTPRILVEPNVLVSQDGNIAHAEVHPTEAQRLVGMATTVPTPAAE